MIDGRIRLAHVNIRSLYPKLKDLEYYVLDKKIDILAVSETWLDAATDTSALHINHYKFFRRDRGGRGGGVGLYVNTLYKVSNISTNLNIEQLWLLIETHKKKICSGVAYRPPNLNYKVFIDELENSFIQCLEISDSIYCCGDFNLDLLRVDDPSVLYFSSFVESIGCTQLINSPTRVTKNTSTLLDVIITSDGGVTDFGVLGFPYSDHDLIHCSFAAAASPAQPVYRTYRDFKNFDHFQFYSELQGADLNYILYIDDVNAKISYLNNIILFLFDRYAPFITRKFTKKIFLG